MDLAWKELREKFRGKTSRRNFLRWSLMAAPGVVSVDGFAIEPDWIRVKRIKVGAGPHTHRVVHFSDVHYKGGREHLENAVRLINAEKPDFACFTGDLVERKQWLAPALEILGGIKCPIYGVPGNHDFWSRCDFGLIQRTLTAGGGAWLMNRQLRTRDGGVNIIGLSSVINPKFTVDPERKNLLLVHYPKWVEGLGGRLLDLTLAGHSHGGQIRLPFYGALMLPTDVGRYELGWYDTKAGPLYVNPGLGCLHFNVRLFCRPELTVFEI